MRDPRDASLTAAAVGFAAGAVGVVALVALAYAAGIVRSAFALAAPFVPVALFGVPVVALVREAMRARGPSGASPARALSPRATALLAGAATPAATMLFALALFEAWTGVRSNGTYMGGLVPVSDAGAYFTGAERLLRDGTLDAWNSRRPLNATLLAARIALAGGDFRGALLLQAALLAGTTALAARALAVDYGRNAGLLLFGGLYVFGGIFVATTMSESLGLSLGALAFALLWHGMRAPRPWLLAMGFAVCSLALNARSGAFLMLPCLLVWAALTARSGRRWNSPSLAAAVAGVAAGFALNTLVSRAYSGAAGGTHSNFSYTLYGLAIGGKGWEQAMADFPQLKGMGDAEAGAFVYARALATMREHPLGFVVGLLRGVECFVLSMSEKLSVGLLDGHPAGQWAFALVWGGGAVVLVRRVLRIHRGDRGLLLVSAAALGALGSVPVIYMDGRERVFAASVAFVIAGAAIAVVSLRPGAAAVSPASAARHARLGLAPAFLAAAIVLTAIVGPRMGRLAARTGPALATLEEPPVCPAGRTPLRVFVRRGLPRIDLLAADRVASSFAPAVRLADFRLGIARDVNLGTTPYEPALRAIGEGETLISAFDVEGARVRHLVVPTGTIDAPGVARWLCGDVGERGDAPVVRAALPAASIAAP